jgi:hypothetical protein
MTERNSQQSNRDKTSGLQVNGHLEDIVLCEVIQVQKDKDRHVFSHTWKIDPKDKRIHKDRHDHTQTQMWNMFVTVELLYGTRGRKERKRE